MLDFSDSNQRTPLRAGYYFLLLFAFLGFSLIVLFLAGIYDNQQEDFNLNIPSGFLEFMFFLWVGIGGSGILFLILSILFDFLFSVFVSFSIRQVVAAILLGIILLGIVAVLFLILF